jgi:hypothetical protein
MRRTLWVLAAAAVACTAPAGGEEATVQIAREEFRGWPDTYRLANGLIEARVVTAIGPRIMDLRRAGGENLFLVRDDEAGGRGEPAWMFRGGWRLWIAPERRETTYALDNAPCRAEIVDGDTLRVTGPPQPEAGIQKIVELSLAPDSPRLRVVSRLRNLTDRPLTYAAWSLSVMRPGGRAFVPLDVGPLEAFDAVRKLLLWSYAEIADPRYRFGDRLIEIDHAQVRPAAAATGRRDDESKIGSDSAQGWAAYLLDRTLYLKRFSHDPTGQYPDGGATIEVYSSAEFLELENLSPLTTIPPAGELTYPEDWWLFSDVTIPEDERSALRAVDSIVGKSATKWDRK